MDQQLVAGQTARQEFGSQELTVRGETAAVAVAAQAKAAVEARYILAMKRPRDLDDVRVRLLRECKRPSFAAVARYEKPIGKDKAKWPKGPSIRFAEAALRCLGNAMPETIVIFESDTQRILQVTCTDLEANLTYSSQIVIQKTVERKFLKDGQTAISTRTNSYGDPVHLIAATEDDLLNKQNALVSKSLRTLALRLLPGDILDDCMTQVLETLRADIKKDPDAAKKAMMDAFYDLNISPVDVAAFLGHSVDRIQPAEIEELRAVYSAIKDGESTWDAVMESRGVTGSEEQQQELREKLEVEAKAKLAERKAQTIKAGSTPAAASTVAEGQSSEMGDGSGDQPQRVQREEPPFDNDPARLPDDKPAPKGKLQFGRRG
jgi:hypothetical protein